MNADQKLLKNGIDEINRLKSQLQDLETYKDDFSPEEIEQIKKDTLDQLVEATKRLEKMKSGQSSIKTEVEKAQEQLNKILCENYNTKEILGVYLTAETKFLRQKLSYLKDQFGIKKMSQEEFNQNAITILDLISKNNDLNPEEKKLYEELKSKSMKEMQKDEGIDKNKIEKKVAKNK